MIVKAAMVSAADEVEVGQREDQTTELIAAKMCESSTCHVQPVFTHPIQKSAN